MRQQTGKAAILTYLEDNFFWGLIGLQEVTNIHKCPLLTGTIFTFEMIPTKLNQLFPMMDKVILEILKKQSGELQKFYSQWLIILSRNLQNRCRILDICYKRKEQSTQDLTYKIMKVNLNEKLNLL